MNTGEKEAKKQAKKSSAKSGAVSAARERGGEDFEPRIYEVGYHILPSVSPEEVPQESAKIKEAIISFGGVLVSEEEPAVRSLEYPISKTVANKRAWFASAYFGWIKFEAESSAPAALKKFLEENEMVLRFLIVKTVRENTLVKKELLESESGKESGNSGDTHPHGIAVDPRPHMNAEGIAKRDGGAHESEGGGGEIDEEVLDKKIDDLVVS